MITYLCSVANALYHPRSTLDYSIMMQLRTTDETEILMIRLRRIKLGFRLFFEWKRRAVALTKSLNTKV